MEKVKIIVADDHLLFVDGIIMLLSNNENYTVVDVANNGKELLEILSHQQPDVVLMDINMPKINGLEALRTISMRYKNIKVVMLSTYKDQHLIEKSIEYGAKGYVLKDVNKDELFQCLQKVTNGECHFPKKTNRKEQLIFEKDDEIIKLYQLTKRELEIMQLIKKGHTNIEMAEILYLSIYTVETHRKNLMQKLGLNTPGSLFNFIRENNL